MKKIVTLRVINPFFDIESNVKRNRKEEFETTEKRTKEILVFDKYQLIEIIAMTRGKK